MRSSIPIEISKSIKPRKFGGRPHPYVLDLNQVARLMRMRPLDTDTVGARGLEKQNGGGSRNKRRSFRAIPRFCAPARSLARDFKAILLK